MTEAAPPPPGNVTPVAIETEMRESFMDYAMSVIVSRALPDARDGLKPVHRRILFAQRGLSNTYNRPYLKCARIVGDVIGKYHPHGDTAVYDALVRMAQDFSMRYMLVDGQGNFGSVDGDPPAAMRYTECRMMRLASEMLADLDKDTVDWQPNYDDKETEPTVLPAKVPNLLLNGSTGIAVGMATNIPPHNLGEILDATLAMIDNPEITDDELIAIVPGPDFPTGGIIQGRQGIQAAFKQGRGSITVRGRHHFEEFKKDRTAIIITELPFQVNKARWIEAAANLVRDKRLEGISDIRDESDRNGMRVVFELKRDSVDQVVLNNLFKMTQLQSNFSVNMLAIVDGRPDQLTLKRALQVFIKHRREVITRRSYFDLRHAEARREIVEGLGLAIMQVDRVIAIIRSSANTDEAKLRLMAEKMAGLDGFLERAGRPAEEVAKAKEDGFVHLNPRQAQAILDMRLARLTGLEREKLEAEYKELWKATDYLSGLLSSESQLVAAIAEELREIRETYADPRRTEIAESEGEIMNESLIAVEDMVVTRTHRGYVKRTPVSEYQAQGRGGKGIKAATSSNDDFVSDMFAASTHDTVLLFTSLGRVYQKRVFELPSGSRVARGKPFALVLELQDDERILNMLAVNSFDPELELVVVFATEQGYIKKTSLTAFKKILSVGIRAVKIAEGDALVEVRLAGPGVDILLASKNGYAIRFEESQVRTMGRDARGVRGMNLRESDLVVGMAVINRDDSEASEASDSLTLLTMSERGYGKRTEIAEYPTKNRGGRGVITMKTNRRNGGVCGIRIVENADHLIVISDKGRLIRMEVEGISVMGRSTQGVRIMRLDEDESVVSIERIPESDDEGETGVSSALSGQVAAPADALDTEPVDMGAKLEDELGENLGEEE